MIGEAAFIEGSGWFGSTGFADPQERDLFDIGDPRFDPTGEWLEELSEDVVRAFMAGDSVALDLVDDVRWRAATLRIPDPAQRLALTVRGIERVLAPAAAGAAEETRWFGAAARYLCLPWCWRQLGYEIRDAGFYGVMALPDRNNTPPRPVHDRFSALIRWRGLSYAVRGRDVIDQAPLLAAELAPGSIQRRMVDELAANTADAASARRWVARGVDAFDRLLARTRRQRNAVVHGTATVPEVVTSVEDFVAELSSLMIGASFSAVQTKHSLLTELEVRRNHALEMVGRLDAGESPALVVVLEEEEAEAG